MAKVKKYTYKYCIVPMCQSTTTKNPNKHFFRVPNDTDKRKKWCKLMRRDIIGPKSTKYVCEDHFDIEKDTENLMRHRLVGASLRLKPKICPHIFDCQKEQQGICHWKRPWKRKVNGDVVSSSDGQSTEFIKCEETAVKEELHVEEDPLNGDCTDTMALPKMEHSPGEVVTFDHLTLRVGNAKTASSYFITRLGFEPFAYRGSTDDRPVVSYAIIQNDIILIFESAVKACVIADDVHAHGDFVKDVAFGVTHLDEVVSKAKAQGAEIVEDITEESDDKGLIRYAVLKTYGDNTHTLVDRSGYAGLLFPGYEPMEKDPLTQILPDTNLTFIDHVEGNMADGTLKDSVDWYEKNLNMKRFWCVDYEHDLVPFSSIKSESVVNRSESVLLSFNEAAPGLRPTSKATDFVKALGSSGVEHIALYTDDIVNTMRSLKSRGAEVLTWPATYYDLIQRKLKDSPVEVKESVEELREHNILIDFDERGYMLQAFTKPLQARPTLFVEIIQRRNHRGFGAMNYKWVFQAIELLQMKQEKE